MSTVPARSRALLFFGILVNLVVFPLNHITGLVVNRGDYTPFSVDHRVSAQVYDETQLYVPGPSRFFRTGQVRAELDVFELRDLPNSYPVLHSILLGLLAKAVGSVEWGWMIAHAILPTAIWVVLFWNACRFVRSAALAMAISWAVCFIAFGPRNFALVGTDRFLQPLELTRTPQPALAFLVLILAIWFLSRALTRPTPTKIVAAGALAGALFYIYYFFWIAFFAGAGSLLIVAAIIRRWNYVKTIAYVLVAGLVTGLPFLLETIDAMRSGSQRYLMSRVGAFTRTPDLLGLIVALILAVALWLYCRFQIRAQTDERPLFGAVLLAVATGAAIGINFHLLTGFNAQHGHFYNRALQPLLGYFLLLVLLKEVRTPPITATAAAIAILTVVATVRQVEVGRNTAAYHRKTSADMDVLLWVRSHVPPDAVVGSSDGNLLTLIPGIAATWTFVPLGDRSMASNREILTRFLLLCRLEGRTWPAVETALRSDLGFPSNASALSYILVMQRKFPPETVEIAKTIWSEIDLSHGFNNRKLDYLIGRRTDDLPASSMLRTYDTLYQNAAWRVSRVVAH